MQPHASRVELVHEAPLHLTQLPLAAPPPTLKVVSATDPTKFFFVVSQGGTLPGADAS